MPVRSHSGDATSWGPLQESLLDQVGLVDVLESAAVFSDCRRNRLYSRRPTLVVLDQRIEDLSVDLVEAQLVDF